MKSSKINRCNTCGRFLSEDGFYWRDKKNSIKRLECKRCHKNKGFLWHEDNKKYRNKVSIQWTIDNRERKIEYMKQYSINNKDKIKRKNSLYKKNNKDKVNICRAKRRTIKLNQHDPTTNPKEVAKLYKLSSILSRDFRPYHVDHIIPLSKDGSSHENNLQIVTAQQNLDKNCDSDSNLKGITIFDIRNHPQIFNTIIGAV